MKTIKKIIVCILSIILVNLVLALTSSICVSNLITTNLIKEGIKQQILTENYLDKANDSRVNISNENINALLEKEEVKELIDKYIDTTMSALTENKEVDINIEQDIMNLIKNNKDLIEQEINHEITDEMINNIETKLKENNINNKFKEIVSPSNTPIPETAKSVLKVYNYFTSNKFRMIVLTLIILDLILIAMTEGSLYKWLKPLGISTTISGLGLITMIVILRRIAVQFLNISILNPKNTYITGGLMITVGIILIIIKEYIASREKKEEKNHEISQVSQ